MTDANPISLPHYIPLLPIPENYIYRNANGSVPAMMDAGNQAALDTLRRVLNPDEFRGANGEVAWWWADGKVTIDEILKLIVFHEGKDNRAVREAVYYRYLYFMGGRNFLGVDTTINHATVPNVMHNTDLDRLVRFLAYYEPWRHPESTLMASRLEFEINFNPTDIGFEAYPSYLTSSIQFIVNEVDRFFYNPTMTVTQEAFAWDVDVVLKAGNFNATFRQAFGDQPYHFANRYLFGTAPANSPFAQVWNKAISNHILNTNRQALYEIARNGNVVLLVLTPNQVMNLCPDGSGVGLLMGDC